MEAKVLNRASAGTIEGVVDPAKHRGKVLTASILGFAFDGVDLMVLALSLPLILKEWGITMVQGGVIATAMLVGASLGGYIFGPLADKFGRKKALVWCIAFFGITTGLGGFAQDYIQLAVLRFLAGLGLGAEWALGGTLLQEFYPADKRGKVSSWMQLGWPLGFGFAIICQHLFVPSYGWRSLYFIGTLAVLVAAYIQLFVPESPVWLKAQDDKKRGITPASAPSGTTADLFKADNLKTFVIASILCVALMITYWAVNTWLPTILVKERGMNPKVYSGFLMGLQFAAAFAYIIAGIVADRYGKRITIIISSFLAAVTLYLWLGMVWDQTMFMTFGAINWACASVIWAVLGGFLVEQFPTNIRAVGIASAYSTGRLVTTVVPLLMGAVAMKVGMTAVMAAISIFYIVGMIAAFGMKETKEHL